MLTAFVAWVVEHRAQAGLAHEHFTTYPEGHPERGWCDGADELEGGHRRATRYWWTDPGAGRFELSPAPDVPLAQLGRCTPVLVAGVEQARLEDGPLAGMVVRREQRPAAPLQVMTLAYLRRLRLRKM